MSDAGDEIAWHAELVVRPGALDVFRELTAEMVERTRNEPGVCAYERHVSAEGATVHVHERYADSGAAAAHPRDFAEKVGTRFAEPVERRRFVVHGRPGAALREPLDAFGATDHLDRLAGFTRR